MSTAHQIEQDQAFLFEMAKQSGKCLLESGEEVFPVALIHESGCQNVPAPLRAMMNFKDGVYIMRLPLFKEGIGAATCALTATGVSWFVIICEMWISHKASDPRPPSEQPDREEALAVSLIESSKATRMVMLPFTRREISKYKYTDVKVEQWMGEKMGETFVAAPGGNFNPMAKSDDDV